MQSLYSPTNDRDNDAERGTVADAAHDLFVTETMAELSARQGRIADAIGIYRRLLAAGPAGDRRARWELRLAALEGGLEGQPGLASLPSAPPPPAPRRAEPQPQPQPPPSLRMPLLIDRPVRSGQVVYAEGRDLIVLAPVNPGAQLMADGNIHVYAQLRGRAVAGVRGCAQAQIFCQRLEAELVGVDAAYIPADDLPVELLGRPARIWLDPGTGQEGPICRVARLIGP